MADRIIKATGGYPPRRYRDMGDGTFAEVVALPAVGESGIVDSHTPQGVAVLSATLTRPADTTPYSINDLVGINTSVVAGNSPAVANAVQEAGDAFRVERVRLAKSNKSTTNAQFRVHIFDRQPTWDVADNGTGGAITALAVTDMVGHVGYIDVTMDRASNTAGAYGVALPAIGGGITVKPNSGTSFYCAVQALAGYTPVSGEVFTVAFEGIRP